MRLFDILHNFPFTKSETITYKHSIYEVLKELPNDLRLRKLGNIRKVSKPHRMIAQRPADPPYPTWKPEPARNAPGMIVAPQCPSSCIINLELWSVLFYLFIFFFLVPVVDHSLLKEYCCAHVAIKTWFSENLWQFSLQRCRLWDSSLNENVPHQRGLDKNF